MSLEYQGALLLDINKDILEANKNLKQASNEANKQGGQIDNTINTLDEAHQDIKNSDQLMKSIIFRKKLYKYFLYGVVALEVIAIIITLISKFF